MDLYNPVRLGIGCWVAAFPTGCDDDDSEVPCERGENASYLIWLFAGIMVAVVLVVVTVCMFVIYFRVRRQVNIMHQLYSSAETAATSAKLRMTAQQAMMYISSFILTYLFTCILRVVENDASRKEFFVLTFLSQVFYPLQGVFNFFIYALPRLIQLKTKFPGEGRLKRMRRLFEIENNDSLRHSTETSRRAFCCGCWPRKSSGEVHEEVSSGGDRPSSGYQ